MKTLTELTFSVKHSANHVHQFQQQTVLNLYGLHRAHLMAAVTPNAFPVIEIQAFILMLQCVSRANLRTTSAAYTFFGNVNWL